MKVQVFPRTAPIQIQGDAVVSEVLSGKTFMSDGSTSVKTGTMVNRGAVTESLTADGQVYTIPEGYHDGTGTVTANIPAVTIGGDATVSQVLENATFMSDGSTSVKTGTMPNRGAVSETMTANGTYTIPEGYHNGTGTVTVDYTIAGDASASEVLSGKTFLSDGSTSVKTGTMVNRGAVTKSLTADGQVYTIPEGYHDGTGTVTANVPATTPTLLWTNPDASQIFGAQTITLDLNNYDGVIVRFNADTSTPNAYVYNYGVKGVQNRGEINRPRGFTPQNSGVVFENEGDGGSNFGTIPYQIWGVVGALPTT